MNIVKTIKNIVIALVVSVLFVFTVLYGFFIYIGMIDVSHVVDDIKMVLSIPDVEEKVVSAIIRYEDDNGSAPESLSDLSSEYFDDSFVPLFDCGKRCFCYTKYPDEDGEKRLYWYGKENAVNVKNGREWSLFVCNIVGKCSNIVEIERYPVTSSEFYSIDFDDISYKEYSNMSFEERDEYSGEIVGYTEGGLFLKYGHSDGERTIHKRDWEMSAKFLSDESFDPEWYEYIYWRNDNYPEEYSNFPLFSIAFDGWGYSKWVRGAEHGKRECFRWE